MSGRSPAPLIAVVGPTASGKTGLAVALCRRFGAEIVGVDASQIYRGLDVGTGKATGAELGGVPHHLVDVVEPGEAFDAAAFIARADAAIAGVRARGRRVVLCGGTGLYLRALVQGLCDAPPVDDTVRATLHARIAAGELATLHAELAAADPVAAARIAPADKQRIERALGVWQTTGRALSDWQAEQAATRRHDVRPIGIRWDRAALAARIEARVDAMLAAGWVDEVRGLIAAGHEAGVRAMQALGYRLIADHLAGRLTLAEVRARTITATTRYAKRQMTWFRKTPDARWFDGPVDVDAVTRYVETIWGAAAPHREDTRSL